MATEKERQILECDVLSAVGRASSTLREPEVTAFLAMRGKKYSNELMVVGRAVNDWKPPGIKPADLANDVKRKDYSRAVYSSVTDSANCPMSWVTEAWGSSGSDYNSRRSAFWRVIRKTVDALEIADSASPSDWASGLVWSNLYKVAPKNGGNPGSRLCSVQFEGCKRLLLEEISAARPKRVLFLTGWNWAGDFLDGLRKRSKKSYVESAGKLKVKGGHESRIVVAVHPQTRPETEWVADVLKAFGEHD